jgi:hypothetical protein
MISTRITPWSPKLLALVVPSSVGGFVFWYYVQQALRGHVAFTTIAVVNIGIFFFVGLLCLVCWLSPLLLVAYVGRWRSLRWAAAAVAVIPMTPWFPWQLWTGLAMLLVLLGLGLAIESIAEDAQNRLTVQPMYSLPRGISFAIFTVLAAISLLYYQQLRHDTSTADALSQKLMDQTVTVVERGLPLIYKQYTSGMTVDQLIGAQMPTAEGILQDIRFSSLQSTQQQQAALNDRLSQLGLDPNSITISNKESEAALRKQIDDQIASFRQQTIDQTRQELSKRFDITITPNESVHNLLVAIIGRQFNRYVRQYVIFVPALLALALFFVLRFATSLLQAVVVWGGWLLMKIYRATHILYISQKTVPAEHVDWHP